VAEGRSHGSHRRNDFLTIPQTSWLDIVWALRVGPRPDNVNGQVAPADDSWLRQWEWRYGTPACHPSLSPEAFYLLADWRQVQPLSDRVRTAASAARSRDRQGPAAQAPGRAPPQARLARPGIRRRACASTRARGYPGPGTPPRSVLHAWALVGPCRPFVACSSSRRRCRAQRCSGRHRTSRADGAGASVPASVLEAGPGSGAPHTARRHAPRHGAPVAP